MPHLTTPRGLNWHYDIAGDGEALLFIHGFGVSSRLWKAQVDHFSTGFKVITVDLPGHGESGWQDVGLIDMAVDLNFILGKLGVDQVNVIGSSFGGLIGLYLLKTGPEKIQRITFVGSLPKFARTPDYPAGLDIERIRKLSSQFDGDYAAMLEIFFRSLFSRQDRESERFKWIKQFHKSDAVPRREALKKFLDILEREDARDVLAHVNGRVQFINGTEDYIVPVEAMKWMEQMLPWANFDYFEGVGHFPFLIKPREFNELLEGFLTS
jgi:pimeloyl-[acyl-carrier protein] methyl ester esterase